MNAGLYAGFARIDVTPMLGIDLEGYYVKRTAKGILDKLEINALAISDGTEKAILISTDQCMLETDVAEVFRQKISEATGIKESAIYIHATHTHTAPLLKASSDHKMERDYFTQMCYKMTDAAVLAIQDMKPARMGWGIGTAPHIAFVRRFRMKDGSISTNPGVDNPDIVEPVGDVDERVSVLRFDRSEGKTILLIHFANHPDVVGGEKISADWPGLLRKDVETILPETECIFFNGAQGDVNHVNVHPKGGDFNDMFLDFDGVSRGYGHARYMARVVTGAVLQVYDKVQYTQEVKVHTAQRDILVPSNMPTPEEAAEAKKIEKLHREGKDAELPYQGMMLTTVVAEAERMVKLEHGPAEFQMKLSALSIGNIALIGIPGEPFMEIGRQLKKAPEWKLVLPTCITNGYEGYFPMRNAYEEGGYEARSSRFKTGVAELIVEEGLELLKEVRL